MKLRTSSLVYRMTDSVFETPSPSLCVFFWQFVWSAVVLLVAFSALGVFALMAATGLSVLILSAGYFVDPLWQPWAINGWTMACFAFVASVFVAGIAFVASVFVAGIVAAPFIWFADRGSMSTDIFSLYRNYMEARESKICPRIEFE